MKLIKVTNELKYAEKSKKLAPIEELYRELNKGKAKEKSRVSITPGFQVRDEGNKTIKVVDAIRSAIDIDQPRNIQYCKDEVIKFFKAVDRRIGIPPIARYGIRSTWIHEYDGSFEELLQKYKESVFNNSIVVENVDDIGVVLDYNIASGKKNSLTFGPMTIEQLQSQFMSYEIQGISKIMLYTSLDVGDTTTKKFSTEFLSAFFDKSIKEGERKASEIGTIVGVKK